MGVRSGAEKGAFCEQRIAVVLVGARLAVVTLDALHFVLAAEHKADALVQRGGLDGQHGLAAGAGAATGLLDGRRCALHFTLRDEFKERFPLSTAVIDKSYVDDRGIITCPGGTAIDLAANLIRRHCGAVRAQKGLEYLLVDERADQQEGQAASDSVYQNDRVQRAIAFMRANLDASMTLKAVAEAVGTHPRQLHREFVANTQEPPANYWRKLRLDHARRLLVNTSQNITTIALACGFSDASHFILWFRKQYGETPYSFRKRRHEVERFDWHGDNVGLDPEL